MITADGCWADFRISRTAAAGRPCLFLDRDGVLIEDTGYPHRREDIVIIAAALDLVRVGREAGYVTGLVTNQSGLARGLFEWPAFSEVQGLIDDALRTAGAGLDFVLACPFHAEATVPRYRRADHAWRKPAAGMLLDAANRLRLDLGQSIMVGDRMSDMEAAAIAGVPHRWLLAGAGASDAETPGIAHVRRDQVAAKLQAMAGPAA